MMHSVNITNPTTKFFKLQTSIAILAIVLTASVALADEDGEKVYKDVCKSCHGGGMKGWLSGAPKAGKKSAWEDHFNASLAQIKTDIFKGTDNHEAMGEKEGLSESAVGAAVDHIISLTPSLSEKVK